MECSATTPEAAKTLEELSFPGEYDIVAFKKMRTEGFIKKVNKTRYFLDVNAWNNPAKTKMKMAMKKTLIIFVVVIVFFGIIVLLTELGIIGK
jgi:hypothetical protein